MQCIVACCAAGFYMDFQFGGIAITFGFLVMFVLMGVAQGLGREDDHSIGKETGYSIGKGGVATSVFPEGSIASAADKCN